MKKRTPVSTVILYIFGFIFLIISGYMLYTSVNYERLYLESFEATFSDMWSNVILYIIEKFVPYFAFAVISFGLGAAIRNAANVTVSQQAQTDTFGEDSPAAVRLEELRQVGSIKLEELERREKVRLEEAKALILEDIAKSTEQREKAEAEILQKLAALEGIAPARVIPEAAEEIQEVEESEPEEKPAAAEEELPEETVEEETAEDAAAVEAVEESELAEEPEEAEETREEPEEEPKEEPIAEEEAEEASEEPEEESEEEPEVEGEPEEVDESEEFRKAFEELNEEEEAEASEEEAEAPEEEPEPEWDDKKEGLSIIEPVKQHKRKGFKF